MSAEITPVLTLLSMPDTAYQRPYRWSTKNVVDLLSDISMAIEEASKYHDYHYRIGSFIFHRNEEDEPPDVIVRRISKCLLAFAMLVALAAPA